jgi:hypothetical protein
MIGRWRIEGHAIVSADNRIAAADGSDRFRPGEWRDLEPPCDAAGANRREDCVR